jgi:type I restriction enzyme, S subunit
MAVESLFASLPSHWEVTKLGEACARNGGNIQTGPFGSQLHASDYVSFGIPSIMPQNIGDNRILIEGIARITPDDANRLSRYLVRKGDIVYSRRGDVERRALIRDDEEGWLCGTGCLRVRFGNTEVDPVYASYYLGHPNVRSWIVRHAIGATMPNLNTSILSALPFVIPPLPEQKAIAHILGTLDDKIELNREMNKTLEAMARAIFKSWFVDFDPVRAKMEGRQPAGMDAATAELFPNEFEESALGMIPKEWRVITLGDIASIKHGYAFKSEFFSDPAFEKPIVVNIGNFKYTGGFRFESTTLKGYIGEYPEEFILSPGDILLVMTCQTAGGEILGIPGTIPNDGRVYLHNQRMGKVVITDSTRVCQEFLYQLFLLPEFNRELFNTASGTKILHTSPSRIEAFNFCLPPIQVQLALAQFLRNLELQSSSNDSESATLASIRDALLPKLLSGEIRVKEAEKVVETIL